MPISIRALRDYARGDSNMYRSSQLDRNLSPSCVTEAIKLDKLLRSKSSVLTILNHEKSVLQKQITAALKLSPTSTIPSKSMLQMSDMKKNLKCLSDEVAKIQTQLSSVLACVGNFVDESPTPPPTLTLTVSFPLPPPSPLCLITNLLADNLLASFLRQQFKNLHYFTALPTPPLKKSQFPPLGNIGNLSNLYIPLKNLPQSYLSLSQSLKIKIITITDQDFETTSSIHSRQLNDLIGILQQATNRRVRATKLPPPDMSLGAIRQYTIEIEIEMESGSGSGNFVAIGTSGNFSNFNTIPSNVNAGFKKLNHAGGTHAHSIEAEVSIPPQLQLQLQLRPSIHVLLFGLDEHFEKNSFLRVNGFNCEEADFKLQQLLSGFLCEKNARESYPHLLRYLNTVVR